MLYILFVGVKSFNIGLHWMLGGGCWMLV